MLQIISEPTRVTQTTESLIDHCITNSQENIAASGVYPVSITEYNLIYAVRKLGISRGNPKFIEARSFKNFSEEDFKFDLQKVKWPSVNSVANVNDFWLE